MVVVVTVAVGGVAVVDVVLVLFFVTPTDHQLVINHEARS